MTLWNLLFLLFNVGFLIGNLWVYRICSRAMGELKKRNPKKPQYWNDSEDTTANRAAKTAKQVEEYRKAL
jgi:hypothetical protein